MEVGKIRKLLITIFTNEQGSDVYETSLLELYILLDSIYHEQLRQLVLNGPVWDGDVVSKSTRDKLIEFGLASRACVKGAQGYTVANYTGWDLYQAGTK